MRTSRHLLRQFALVASTLVCVVSAVAQNLIVNPAFEAGNVSFTSDYRYDPTYYLVEGRYAIVTNPNSIHPNFLTMGDHTTGTGKMLLVNGATTGTPTVWRQVVTVEQSQTYLFSAWASNVVNGGPGTFVFRVNGTTLEPQVVLPSTGNQWQNYSTLWGSGSATSATLEIIFTSNVQVGNDAALDDLMFRKTLVQPVSTEIFNAAWIEWNSAVGADYQVQSSTDLTTWISIGTPIVGTGGKLSYSEKITKPAKFFRVIGLNQ